MPKENIQIGGILLAAGGSTRLGQPKQLLSLQGKTLVERTVATMQKAIPHAITVVTGGSAEKVADQIQNYQTHIAHNAEWESGMASSIRTGLENLLMHYPNIDAVIICLCDQPFLNSQHLLALQNQYVKTGKKIVASVYDNLESVPALFDKVMFGELLSLKGQEGARKVIRKAGDDLIGLPFSKGIYDVDTPAAWEKVKVLFKE